MWIFNIPYRLLLFAGLTVALIVVCFMIKFINMPILDALDERGHATQAEVIWVGEPYWVWQRGNYSRGGYRIDMRYAYVTRDGQRIEDEHTMVKQNARSLVVGRRFDLVYLPEDPVIHDSDYGNGYAGIGMIYALIPMIAVCAFMAVFFWWRLPPGWQGPKLWPPLRAE